MYDQSLFWLAGVDYLKTDCCNWSRFHSVADLTCCSSSGWGEVRFLIIFAENSIILRAWLSAAVMGVILPLISGIRFEQRWVYFSKRVQNRYATSEDLCTVCTQAITALPIVDQQLVNHMCYLFRPSMKMATAMCRQENSKMLCFPWKCTLSKRHYITRWQPVTSAMTRQCLPNPCSVAWDF